MTKIIILFLLSITTVFADDKQYWSIEIPVAEDAVNVFRDRNKTYYILSTSYEVKLNNTEEIYNFYKEFFENMGWENPMKNFPKSKYKVKGKWETFRSTFNQEGFPESTYASMWKSKSVPATAVVNLTLTDYNDGKFNAKVKVSISPEVDNSPLFKLQELMMKDPKNIFILHKAIDGNPLEFDKIKLTPKKEYKNNELVKEYYKAIDKLIEGYEEFGKKYVQQ